MGDGWSGMLRRCSSSIHNDSCYGDDDAESPFQRILFDNNGKEAHQKFVGDESMPVLTTVSIHTLINESLVFIIITSGNSHFIHSGPSTLKFIFYQHNDNLTVGGPQYEKMYL